MADWQAIKTEYITTDTSYRKLAQKYGIHYKVISERGKDEKWVELRSQHRDKTLTKTLDQISQQQADRAAKVLTVADKLLLKIEALADMPGLKPKDARSLVAAASDLKERIYCIKSDLDEQEQKARIANLQKQAETDNGSKEPIKVIIGSDLEEYSK